VGGTGDSDNAVFVAYWVWDRSLANSLQKSGVLALSLAEGKPLWRQELGDNDLSARSSCARPPRAAFSRLGQRNVYALDAATGACSGRRPNSTRFAAAGVLRFVVRPMVVTGSKYGTVRGLEAATGAERWNYKTGDRITGSPAILVERDGRARSSVPTIASCMRSMPRLAHRLAFRCSRGRIRRLPWWIPAEKRWHWSWDGPHVARRRAQDREPLFSASLAGAVERRRMDDSNWSSPRPDAFATGGCLRGQLRRYLRALPLGRRSARRRFSAPIAGSAVLPLVLIPFLALTVGSLPASDDASESGLLQIASDFLRPGGRRTRPRTPAEEQQRRPGSAVAKAPAQAPLASWIMPLSSGIARLSLLILKSKSTSECPPPR